MMRPSRITALLAVLLLFAGLPTLGAEEFEDTVPVELVRLFLGAETPGELGLYRDFPDDFPAFELPTGATVLGGLERASYQEVWLQLAAGTEAEARLNQSLEAAGWRELQLPPYAGNQGGFVNAGQERALPEQYCHNAHGFLTVGKVSGDNGRLVRLQWNPQRRLEGGACEQIVRASAGRVDPMTGSPRPFPRSVQEYLPRLELPESNEPSPGAALVSGNSMMRGGLDDVESRASLVGVWSLGELYAHFAEQLREQDWLEDASWQGSFVTGGAWTWTTSEGEALIGLLTVVSREDERYDLSFRLQSRAAADMRQAGVVGVRP